MAIFRGTGSASATADQTTIDTVTQAVVDAEAAQTAAEAAQTAAETAKTNAENLYGDLAAVSTAKTDAETAATTATTKASEASDDAADAQKLALNPVDSEFTLSDGSTTGYSALHYNTQTQLRYDNFDDRYLGAKSAEPSVDNDGDPLITGAMYFDTTDNLMYVWTGSGWVNVTPSSTVTISQVTDVTSNASELNILDVSAQTPSDGQVLTYNTVGDLNWATPTDLVGISNLVEDTTPQLGGDLDTNGNAITGTSVDINASNGDLMITATQDGPVALRYDGNLKLSTKSDGVNITGELEADSLDIDGDGNISGTLTLASNGALTLPVGTEAQRPTPVKGMFRFNDDSDAFEGYDGAAWGAVGGGNTAVVGWENQVTVAENYTITSGNNMVSAGPITIDTGFTVTVPSGSRWVVV